VKKSLKKLPAPDGSKRRSRKPPITVDVRTQKKDFSSIVALLKRKYGSGEDVPMPADLKPMMATLADAAFNHADWQFEIKLDGYRALAYLQNGRADLRSRNNNSFKKFAPVLSALMDWKINAVVDGEIVVLNEDGHSDFSGIQQWEKKGAGHLLF
jgi:bifunctional non-homologous end joining protein LigD